jgi:predicted Zn-dependent peptidase
MGVNIKRLRLKNGIRVVIVPLKTKLTYISTNYLFGRYQEKKHEMGLTHYCEHLLGSLTSEKYKNSIYVSEEIYKKGGKFNAYVSDYELCIHISGLYDDLEFYIDILSNTINNFYVENDIKIKEKGSIIQEYMGYLSDDKYVFEYNMFKFLYPKYSYLLDYKEQIKYIKNYNSKKINKYIKDHLNTDNLVITVTCPLNKINETIKNIKKYFGVIKYKKSTFNYPVIKHSNTILKIVNIKNFVPDKNDSIIIHLSKRIENFSEEYIILKYYIKRILFNFESGIFYKILRKKLGIIYNIHLSIHVNNYNADMSYYNIKSKCHRKYMPIFIENFLNILKNYEMDDEHILNAKNYFKFEYESSKFYNLNSYNDEYKEQLIFNKNFISNKDIYEKIISIKPNKIKDYYNNVFVKDILSRHIFFYYSNININKTIETLYKKHMPIIKCKTHYIH